MQSAMCIPLWPARNASTAHLVMCPFAGGSSSAFRRWRDHPMAEIALSLVTWPGRDRLPASGTTGASPTRADYFRLPCPSSAFPAQAQRPR